MGAAAPAPHPLRTAPVAVGGVGGSGTRLVAQLLSEAGFYLGGDLNAALDNLWFTVLLKRPAWYRRSRQAGSPAVEEALAVFQRVMVDGGRGALESLPALLGAATEMARHGHAPGGAGRGPWPYRRVWSMLRAKPFSTERHIGWGWKEPNTHLFLPELARQVEGLRYVHVIRHGLDMAFSENQNQLQLWGWLLDVETADDPMALPGASVEFWVAANERAIELGGALLGDRFLVVNVDALCQHPGEGVARILEFLEIEVPEVARERLRALPKTPASSGRYLREDLSCFTTHQIEAVRRLGFPVET